MGKFFFTPPDCYLKTVAEDVKPDIINFLFNFNPKHWLKLIDNAETLFAIPEPISQKNPQSFIKLNARYDSFLKHNYYN
jgi:hypothetical protein